jgi:hypothetical protein
MRMTVPNSGLPVSPSALYKLSRFRPAFFAISAMPRARDGAERIAHEIRVAGLQRRRNIGSLSFFAVEIVDGVKSYRLGHHCLSASA